MKCDFQTPNDIKDQLCDAFAEYLSDKDADVEMGYIKPGHGVTKTTGNVDTSQLPQFTRLQRLLTLHVDADRCIAPSTVAQKHIRKSDIGNSYPVCKVIELLQTAAQPGFGEMET